MLHWDYFTCNPSKWLSWWQARIANTVDIEVFRNLIRPFRSSRENTPLWVSVVIPSHSWGLKRFPIALFNVRDQPAAIKVSFEKKNLTSFCFLHTYCNAATAVDINPKNNLCHLQYFTRSLRSFISTNELELNPNASTVNTKYYSTRNNLNNLGRFGIEGTYRHGGSLTSNRSSIYRHLRRENLRSFIGVKTAALTFRTKQHNTS